MPNARCSVYFRAGATDLEAVVTALVAAGMTATRSGEFATVGYADGPALRLSLKSSTVVRDEATARGKGTRHARSMVGFDARVDVDIEDLDRALDEINSLIVVQGTVQELTRGYLYTPWNGGLHPPL
jgi:hypothetical protein